jgi:micrococcal nuclease
MPRRREPARAVRLREIKPRPFKKDARSADDLRPLIHRLPIGRVLQFVDGDTLVVTKGQGEIVVRLDSIDCPEDGQHWGDEAKLGLVKLVGGRQVQVEEHGIDDYGRTLATLYIRHSNGQDWQSVNERMVGLGHAWVMRKYYDHLPPDRQERLNNLEARAKSKNVGL